MTPEQASAPVAQKLPQRTDLDIEIDRFYHLMVAAEIPEMQAHYCQQMTALINQRNDARSAEEIAELERQKGLR